MKHVCIFAQVLYSIQYDTEETHELDRLFDLWQDIEYLHDFFEQHKGDLQSNFYGNISIEEAIRETRKEARWLESEIKRLAISSHSSRLQEIFRPLDNNQYKIIDLLKSKAKGNRRTSWLRLYAIKINSIFVITGGTIKLTATMNDRLHTQIELQKLEKCKSYFKQLGITDEEAFKDVEI